MGHQPDHVKARGIIISLALAALVIGVMGLALLWGRREPWARIQFTEARFSNDGTLTFAYNCTYSSGAFLHEADFRNGVSTGDGVSGGDSLFGWPSSESGRVSMTLSQSEMTVPPPLLVETGRTYVLKLHDQLRFYDFTNKSGMSYQGRFWVHKF